MFHYGKWEIEIDEAKTKAYYASLPVNDSQSNRNFRMNAERFTEEEKAFFDRLHVDFSKVNLTGFLVVSTYLRKKLHWECSGDIYVFGTMFSTAEISEESDEDDDPEINVGRFRLNILRYDERIPKDGWPEGAIYISLNYAELDWLLDEKCKDVYPEGVSMFQVLWWKIQDATVGRITKEKDRRKITAVLTAFFERYGVRLTPMTKSQTRAYKKEWVHNYTDDPKIAAVALPARKVHNLLWHVFSYNEGKAIEGDDAQSQYDRTEKNEAVIYIDDIDTAFRAAHIEAIFSAVIEKLCDEELGWNMDITITAADFSWTYCRTHEAGWIGPYFYRKSE